MAQTFQSEALLFLYENVNELNTYTDKPYLCQCTPEDQGHWSNYKPAAFQGTFIKYPLLWITGEQKPLNYRVSYPPPPVEDTAL